MNQKRTKFILITLLLLSSMGFSQTKHTISGYIREAGSKELLIGVNVYFPKLKTGTTSNTYGFYSITLPDDSLDIAYSYIGYQTQIMKIKLDKDLSFNIDLAKTIELSEVVISARNEKISETTKMSSIDIPIAQIKNIPTLLGEKDVFKVLQLMPGVQKGSEGNSGIYVRGGGPDQNLIILDDAQVYNANHLFGFFSVFNGDALKSVELIKGGFPARYGGRLSSVIDMNMKEGNKEKLTGEAGIGLISSRLTLEGPILKGKSSFIVSGRRTYIDMLIRPFLNPEVGVAGYYFYDLNAKANYDFGDKDKLYISGYFGRDKFGIKQKNSNTNMQSGLYWQNATSTARWNHLINNKLFLNTSFIFSDYTLNISSKEKYDQNTYELLYKSGIRDFSLKSDFYYTFNPKNLFRFGAVVCRHQFTPSAFVFKDSYNNLNESKAKYINSIESGLYVEDEAKLSERLKVNGGLRLSDLYSQKKSYLNLEPRLASNYKLNDDLSFKLSYALMNQYIHLLSNTGIGLPTDLWVPATSRTKPQQSQQIAAGFAKDFIPQNFTLSIEGYYKASKNIITYKEGASFLGISDPTEGSDFTWEDNITSGKGWSYGGEILLQRKTGKFSGWIGYTLSWTQLQFDEVNFGKKFWAKYDRRHDISVVMIYEIKKNITLSATWVYGTGNAISLPLGEQPVSVHNMVQSSSKGNDPNMFDYLPTLPFYGEKNGYRMKAYHRADIGIQWHKEKKWGERTFELGFYNAYNRKNPFFYFSQVELNSSNQSVRKLKQVSIFPIIPSISWTFKF
ncbi:MAG: TonB-dependent receptor [Bacteroidota bacterium]